MSDPLSIPQARTNGFTNRRLPRPAVESRSLGRRGLAPVVAAAAALLMTAACSGVPATSDTGGDVGSPDAGDSGPRPDTVALDTTDGAVPDALPDGTPDSTPDGTPDTGPAGIEVLAGSAGGSGNIEGPRRDARFNGPSGVARAADGTVYVADTTNYVIRRIAPDGTVSTLAGASGRDGTADGTGSAARFLLPASIVLDPDGNLIVSDSYASTLRKVTPAGVVTTWIGQAGDPGSADGTLAEARFRAPEGLAFDADGNLFVADREAHTIRRIAADGQVTTFVGTDLTPGSTGGDRAQALLDGPFGVATGPGGILAISDANNNVIRLVDAQGQVSTLAGLVGAGQDTTDGTGEQARFGRPRALVFDATGNLLVADTFNDRLRQITPAGVVTTYGGTVAGSVDGPLGSARFQFPSGFALATEDGEEVLYVADTGSSVLRRVAGGEVETFAGAAVDLAQVDGTGLEARFFSPTGFLAREDGQVLVADTYGNALRQVSAEGEVVTLGGSIRFGELRDGPLAQARFNQPRYLLDDGKGGYLVSDTASNVIRQVSAQGEVSTLAGGPVSPRNTFIDGPLLEARFQSPSGLARDAAGNVYVADSGNHAIRRIGTDGMVTTVAGDGLPDFIDGPASEARFFVPDSVVVLDATRLLVSDAGNHILRLITLGDGEAQVSTFAGTAPLGEGEPQNGDDDGVGTAARFNAPHGLWLEADGSAVLVADTNSSLIRRVSLADADVTTVAGTRGLFGIAPGPSLPGVIFEPQALVRLADGALLVTYQGGILRLRGL